MPEALALLLAFCSLAASLYSLFFALLCLRILFEVPATVPLSGRPRFLMLIPAHN